MASSLQDRLTNNHIWNCGQSLNRPENRNPGQWDETITDGKMGKFRLVITVAFLLQLYHLVFLW